MNLDTKKLIEKRYGKLKVYPDGFSVKEVMHNSGSGKVEPILQEKPWGAEVWLVYTPRYAFKHFFIENGKRLSLQKHTEKSETYFVASGEAAITLNDKKITAKAGDVIHVDAGTAHRIEASNGDVEIFEASSPELWDVTRLEDDYGR